jgi:hypothetical protein
MAKAFFQEKLIVNISQNVQPIYSVWSQNCNFVVKITTRPTRASFYYKCTGIVVGGRQRWTLLWGGGEGTIKLPRYIRDHHLLLEILVLETCLP